MEERLLEFLVSLFEESELNRLPKKFSGGKIFSNPLIGVASGNDPLYLKYKKVVGPEHLTPKEMWKACGQEVISSDLLRVLSIIFPYTRKIRDESKDFVKLKRVTLPSEYYSIGRNYANAFLAFVMEQLVEYFQKKRFNAVAGGLNEAFSLITKGYFYSTWSERHTAFVAGLGTFSLHEGFITEVGCNVRLASVITSAPLKVTPRISDNPYANCLFYSKGTCKSCVEKCPAGAISENGHDKNQCYYYGRKVARKMEIRLGSLLKPHVRRVDRKLGPPSHPVGCAFCQFGVPCMDKNPTAKEHILKSD